MKKFSAIIICLLLVLTCTLTGCAGFSVDRVKYYNEVVAKVGDYEITRFELLNSYNSYNQYGYMQSDQDESEAIKDTLDLLIDREALYQYAVNFKLEGGENPYTPEDFQINDIVQSIFDSLDSQMESFVSSAKRVLGIKEKDDAQDDEESSTAYPKPDYSTQRRAVVDEAGNIKYLKEYKEEPENWEPLISTELLKDFNNKAIIGEIKTKYLQHFKEDLTEAEGENATKIYNLALKELSTSLINYEYYLRDKNGKPYNKVTDDLLNRYFERTFTAQLKSKYLSNMQEYYLVGEHLSTSKLIDAYRELVQANIDEFDLDASSYKSKMKNISTDGDSVLYHPTLQDTQFGYFYHILFQFDDNQKTEGADNVDTANLSLEDVLSTTAPVRNLSGNEVGKITLKEFLSSPEFTKLKSESSYENKLSQFINLMFKYSEDTATLSSGMPYVVGTYDTTKGETFSQNSAMVEEFTNEAISLMSGNEGAISNITASNKDSMCITTYGVHILFYVGDVNRYDIPKNYINQAFIEFDEPEYASEFNLFCKEINPCSHKTYFDMLFDTVYPSGNNGFTSNTNYSFEEKELVKSARNNISIEIYDGKLAGTSSRL